MLDTEGYVSEGSSYNIAAMIDGTLITPKDNCLEGRTMKMVIEIARRIDVPARYDNLSLYDLYNSPEAFITGSSNVMLPVRTVDGRRIGDAWPGPIQERIWVEWDRMVGFDVRRQARDHLNNRTAPGREPVIAR
jgi:branched-subunit amino acid aminotransferase/4-amino-4-deoxychorismate lyase